MDKIKFKYSENVSTQTLFCGPCGVVIESIGTLKVHGICEHEDLGNKCRPCENVATTGAKLKWYMISVHESLSTRAQSGDKVSTWTLSCDSCGNGASRLTTLRMHKSEVHGAMPTRPNPSTV